MGNGSRPGRRRRRSRRWLALLGLSNLEDFITMVALSKLGHTVLLLSTRITQAAIESLMVCTGAHALVVDGKRFDVASNVKNTIHGVQLLSIAQRQVFEFSVETYDNTKMAALLQAEKETNNSAFITCSSGKLPPC